MQLLVIDSTTRKFHYILFYKYNEISNNTYEIVNLITALLLKFLKFPRHFI